MSQYTLQQFVKLWAQERVTNEQAIGQILLQLQDLTERLKAVEQWRWNAPGAEADDETQ